MTEIGEPPLDTIGLLTSRASIGADFMAEPGPTDVELRQILAAGLRVPDHGRLFPWRVQVLRKEAQRRLAEVYVARYRALNADAREAQIEHDRRRPQRAPVLLAVSNRLQPGHKIPVLEQTLSGGAMCMNILNAAHLLGFAAQWVTGWIAYDEVAGRILGLQPGERFVAIIHIGTSTVPPVDRPRPPLSEIVSEWEGP